MNIPQDIYSHVGYTHKWGIAKGEIEFRVWFCSYFKLKWEITVKANGKHSVERLTKLLDERIWFGNSVSLNIKRLLKG